MSVNNHVVDGVIKKKIPTNNFLRIYFKYVYKSPHILFLCKLNDYYTFHEKISLQKYP